MTVRSILFLGFTTRRWGTDTRCNTILSSFFKNNLLGIAHSTLLDRSCSSKLLKKPRRLPRTGQG